MRWLAGSGKPVPHWPHLYSIYKIWTQQAFLHKQRTFLLPHNKAPEISAEGRKGKEGQKKKTNKETGNRMGGKKRNQSKYKIMLWDERN